MITVRHLHTIISNATFSHPTVQTSSMYAGVHSDVPKENCRHQTSTTFDPSPKSLSEKLLDS